MDILAESEKALNNRIENDKKDRIIWSLLENGKSRYTDYEFVAKKIINEVLSKKPNEQITEFEKFCDKLYHTDCDKVDNRTIFLFGIPAFVQLFKSFIAIDANFENKKALFELYLEIKKKNNIDMEFIQVLNYFSVKDKQSYIWILGKINSLNVIGNFNSNVIFNNLLRIYIDSLSRFGYIDTRDCFGLPGAEGDIIKGVEAMAIQNLEDVEHKIQQLKSSITVNVAVIQTELQTISNFIIKLIEIIRYETEMDDNKSGIKVKTKFSSNRRNQDEYDRIKKMLEENSDETLLANELQKNYLNGKINMYEINELFKNKDSNK